MDYGYSIAAAGVTDPPQVIIEVLGFKTLERTDMNGKVLKYDVVEYSPGGDENLRISAPIEQISSLKPMEHEPNNTNLQIGHIRWHEIMKPLYLEWKGENADGVPDGDTPIQLYPGFNDNDRNRLMSVDVYSVEQFIDLGKALASRVEIDDMDKKRTDAVEWLKIAKPAQAMTSEEAEAVRAENRELKADVSDLKDMVEKLLAATPPPQAPPNTKGGKSKGQASN